MHVKTNLRHEMGIVVSQAGALIKALKDLPDTVDAMEAALTALTVVERQQLAEHLATLAQMGYQLHERSRWLRRQLLEGL